MGAGKTLTAVSAGARSSLPSEVIAPAPLVANYEKEVRKHVKGRFKRRVRSYATATRRAATEPLNPDALLVLDEAHRLRNTGTKQHKAIAVPARKAKKRLLLTGTSIYNRPSDIAVLTNIARGEVALPENPYEFDRKFIQDELSKVTLLQRVRGMKPGVRRTLKNREELLRALAGHVDVHEGEMEGFPARVDETVKVPMTRRQMEVHDTLMDRAPYSVRAKVRAGLPPSKQESKSLNAYLTGSRQVSLTPRTHVEGMTDSEEDANIPKIREAVRRLVEARKSNPKAKSVVYSNYIGAGLKPYARQLKAEGVPFEMFTGGVTRKEKARIIKDYNAGKSPVLLVSSSGTEGLDLKGTRLVQVLEPHFNNSKIEQVVARGIRYKSHDHLPEEDRTVQVQRFLSTRPPSEYEKALGLKPGFSTEEWLQQQADNKDALTAQLREVMLKAHDSEKLSHIPLEVIEAFGVVALGVPATTGGIRSL